MHTNLSRPAVAVTLALSALLSGCSGNPTRPLDPNVQMSLTVQPTAGSPSNPISLSLRAVNAGVTPIWHCDGCGCGNGTKLTVLDPSGKAVALWDPNGPKTSCPDGPMALPPDSSLKSHESFTGVLYVTDSNDYPTPTYQAPAGNYTVVAEFFYAKTSQESYSGPSIRIERKATFTWAP
jgi:hypothetical protein